MTTTLPTRWALAGWGLWVCCVLGCGGAGHVEITSLNYRAIDPPTPRVVRINMDRCYWWSDDEGQVWIAMERIVRSPFNRRARFEFRLSLALERLPRGRARNYEVAKHELRAVVHVGPLESRFTSLSGIVALYREPDDRLRGSFRLQTARQVNRLLGGWGRPSRYLIFGTFAALRDEQRGRAIVAATESSGWGRERRSSGEQVYRSTAGSAGPGRSPHRPRRAQRIDQ